MRIALLMAIMIGLLGVDMAIATKLGVPFLPLWAVLLPTGLVLLIFWMRRAGD
jgi:hypothetical protein